MITAHMTTSAPDDAVETAGEAVQEQSPAAPAPRRRRSGSKESKRKPPRTLGSVLRTNDGDPRDQRVQIYVTMSDYMAIVDYKERTGRSASEFISQFIREGIAREGMSSVIPPARPKKRVVRNFEATSAKRDGESEKSYLRRIQKNRSAARGRLRDARAALETMHDDAARVAQKEVIAECENTFRQWSELVDEVERKFTDGSGLLSED